MSDWMTIVHTQEEWNVLYSGGWFRGGWFLVGWFLPTASLLEQWSEQEHDT